MLVAQAFGEYGASALVDRVSERVLYVIDALTSLTPFGYVLLVGAAFLVWFVFRRR